MAALTVEIVDRFAAADETTAAWTALHAADLHASLYATPLFCDLSWHQVAAPGDAYWLLVAREGTQWRAVWPLLMQRQQIGPWRLRVLRQLGQVYGDRPRLVCLGDRAPIWSAMLDALARAAHRWDRLELRELDTEQQPAEPARALGERLGWPVDISTDTYAGILPVSGRWEDYYAGRSSNLRSNIKRYERKLREACGDVAIECVTDPADVGAAFSRFVSLEAQGWKGAAVSLQAKPQEAAIYRALVDALAPKGQVQLWFLRADGRDVAAALRLLQGATAIERYVTYDQAYARYSPGVLLDVPMLRWLFENGIAESDAQGMTVPLAERPAMRNWFSCEVTTYRLRVWRDPWALRLGLRAWRAWRDRARVNPTPNPGAAAPLDVPSADKP